MLMAFLMRNSILRIHQQILVTTVFTAMVLLSQSSTQTTLRNPPSQASHALFVTFGIGDKTKTSWDGTLEVSDGVLIELIGYEMGIGDIIHPPRRWEMSTRPAFAFSRRNHDKDILEDLPPDTYLSPRFYVFLNGSPTTRIAFQTNQGRFELQLADIPDTGNMNYLNGRVSVSLSPLPMLIGRGGSRKNNIRLTDNDFPSIAVTQEGTIWVAYSGFSGDTDRIYADRILPGQGAAQNTRPMLSANRMVMCIGQQSPKTLKARSGFSGQNRSRATGTCMGVRLMEKSGDQLHASQTQPNPTSITRF